MNKEIKEDVKWQSCSHILLYLLALWHGL